MGLMGLEDAFEEVRSQIPDSDEKTAELLLERVRKKNYIASGVEEEYKRTLLREYKKYFGEPVEEEQYEGLRIQILGLGCPICERLERAVQEVLVELNLEAALDHIRDPQEIAETGVIGTPALIINGKVRAVGKATPKNQVKVWIQEENRESCMNFHFLNN